MRAMSLELKSILFFLFTLHIVLPIRRRFTYENHNNTAVLADDVVMLIK